MRAITPAEVGNLKQAVIPDRVIEIVNELIVKRFSGRRAVVKQNDILAAIRADDSLDSADIWNENWLDFEPIFEAAGWEVIYDKPGYNETYPATFEFRVPR